MQPLSTVSISCNISLCFRIYRSWFSIIFLCICDSGIDAIRMADAVIKCSSEEHSVGGRDEQYAALGAGGMLCDEHEATGNLLGGKPP